MLVFFDDSDHSPQELAFKGVMILDVFRELMEIYQHFTREKLREDSGNFELIMHFFFKG
jgi:hypothetical protein